MKVLIATLHYLNGVGGGVFASRAYINAFARLFPSEVTLLYPTRPGAECEGIDPTVTLIPFSNTKSRVNKALDLLTGHMSMYESILPEILREGAYDLVVFDNSRVSHRLIDEAHRAGAKVVTIHHNCELEYNRDNSSSLLRPVMLHWTRCYEGEAVRNSDLNLTLTAPDVQLLKSHYRPKDDVRFDVIGCFESKDRAVAPCAETTAASAATRFIITGNLSAKQTVDSLIPWIDTYYPIIKEAFPRHKLTIAGKNPTAELCEKAREAGIDVIPNPADMKPLLDEADVYICPTEKGGGLKLRIMDGLKSGLPVVTHTVSARGYEPFADAGVLFAYDSPDSFRQACEALKKGHPRAETVVGLYDDIFSFTAGCRRLKSALEFMQ